MTLDEALSERDVCENCGKGLTQADVFNGIDAETIERQRFCIECWKSTFPHPENTCEFSYCVTHGVKR